MPALRLVVVASDKNASARPRPLRRGIHGIERLACSHEQPITLGPAEGDVAAHFGDANPPEQLALRRPHGHAAVADARPALLEQHARGNAAEFVKPDTTYQAALSKTPVNQSGSTIITEWPDVVFSRTVQDLSALHSPTALSNAAN